tara:strand:+ start:1763 stop:3100 length:1338 start_codon:yes stop_codon:yes gene_type:complete
MKILILDVYPQRPYRISKDNNGGYGSSNKYGSNLISKAINWFVKKNIDWPTLGSVHVAGILKSKGHEVDYSREFPKNLDFYDFFIIPSSIVCSETEIQTIKKLKMSNKIVAVIGPFATSNPEKYIKSGAFVIKGEPEMFFFNENITIKKIKKIKGIVNNFNLSPLDDLPLPAWDVIYKKYPSMFSLLSKNKKMIPLLATRGCPYSCRFYCTYPLQQGIKVRQRDPKLILNEMKHWKKTLGVNFFIFRDPVFSINRKHTIELCNVLINSKENFKFIIETHLNNLDLELLKKLKSAGVIMIKVGVESAISDVKKDANRFSITEDDTYKKIKEIESLGIHVTTMFILGYPTDTLETCRATINYAKQINSIITQFTVFTPYPGTPAFKDYEKRIFIKNFEDFTMYDLIFKHKNLSPEDIEMLKNEAYTKCYLNKNWVKKYFFARTSLPH